MSHFRRYLSLLGAPAKVGGAELNCDFVSHARSGPLPEAGVMRAGVARSAAGARFEAHT